MLPTASPIRTVRSRKKPHSHALRPHQRLKYASIERSRTKKWSTDGTTSRVLTKRPRALAKADPRKDHSTKPEEGEPAKLASPVSGERILRGLQLLAVPDHRRLLRGRIFHPPHLQQNRSNAEAKRRGEEADATTALRRLAPSAVPHSSAFSRRGCGHSPGLGSSLSGHKSDDFVEASLGVHRGTVSANYCREGDGISHRSSDSSDSAEMTSFDRLRLSESDGGILLVGPTVS